MEEGKVDGVMSFVLNFYGPILTAILVVFVLLLFYILKFQSTLRKTSFADQHFVITGGSSGIGKSVAIQAAKKGANITIIARDPAKLKAAKEEIIKSCISPLQRVITISLDVSRDADAVSKAILEAEEDSGPIFMLVNCAGQAICGQIEDLSVDEFKFMMDLNYFGTVYPIKAVIAGMKERRAGHIVITASQAAMIGIYGFTGYSASKFALRGFAEALDMEVRPYGVRVTVCLPPDTDTPGFATEEINKPMETRLISQTSGLVSPDLVATHMLNDAIAGKFFSTVGFEGFLLTTGCVGMSPVTSVRDLICEVFLMGLIRLVSVYYLLTFQGLSIEQITAQAFTFFIAGFSTNTSNMTFCLNELSRRQDIQEKLFTDIKQALDKHQVKMSYKAILDMTYLDQVILETLRLYGSGQTLTRICTKHYTIPGSDVTLEKGTRILIPIYSLHHDPQYFPNPYSFEPERFNPDLAKNMHSCVYLPFGEGPRNCIARNVGLLQMKLGIATVISNFKVNLVSKEDKPIDIDNRSFVLTPAHPVYLKLTKR